MAEPGGDFLAELTTAPIFDDAVYLAEALQLPVNEDEDDLDTELAMSARESGIEDPYRILYPDAHLISPSMSMISLRSEHRNSPSIHSRETQSTNFTSPTSRASRDEFYKEQPPVLRTPPLLSRASLSVDQPATIGHTLPGIRHRHSSSASRSSAPESLSAPSSARKPSTRKHKRGSALFSMFRKDASNTISPSRRPRSKGPGFETSPCLSQLAVRAYAIGALDGNDISYTGPKLDTLVTTDELVSVTRSALTSSASQSLRDSGYSEDGISTVDLSHALDHDKAQPTSLATPVLETCWQDEHGFHMALANEAFKSMMAEQRQQLQRVSKFESDQRKALLSHHQWSLKRLRTQWKTTKAKRKKQHPIELERLEEFQLKTEADLHKAHATEAQNVATALKYMTAYCSGTSSSQPELTHTVTGEDRNKLEYQRVMQEKLPAKHESAINVLRGKQEKDCKAKLQKQQAELRHLDEQYERDIRAEELLYAKDSSRLDRLRQTRRERILNRWNLKVEIWRKDWESQHGMALNGRLPHEDWPEVPDTDATISKTSALAIYTQIGV